MNIIGWIIIGGLAGWIASMVTGRNDQMGCLMNIVVGVVGGIIGGWLMQLLTDADPMGDFSIQALLVAIVGAVILLGLVNLIFGRRRAP
jgi:uncharacterized membrane protein YeaQ/YmgE (transglycosylase-associated protein family)